MKRLIHFGLVLLIIASVAAGLLGYMNKVTAPKIAAMNVKIINEARKGVLEKAKTFNEEKAVTNKEIVFIPGYDKDGNLVGYASTVETNGYSGVITFVLGVDLDGKVTGLKVTNQTETPGLGTNIEKKEWQALWIGRTKEYRFDKSVDAFAGATISPTAVYTGVIKALYAFEGVRK